MSEAYKLHARLSRTPDEHVATRRELAVAYARRCPRSTSAWAHVASSLVDLRLFKKAFFALKRLQEVARAEDAYIVFIRWGDYYKSIGDLRRAGHWYRKAAKEEQGALVFVGAVLARQGRFAEAKRYHRQATRAGDTELLARDEAYYNLALIFRAQRRYQEALDNFDRAIALDPKYTDAFEMRADVRRALQSVAADDRATHWRETLDAMISNRATGHELARAYTKRYPKRLEGWLALADILASFARYDEGAAALRRSERLAKSENVRVSLEDRFAIQWGIHYERKRDFPRAELAFRRAVALRTSADALTELGAVLVTTGQLTEAQRYLQRAIRHESKDPSTAYYQLGLIARARRRYADGVRHFDAAIQHDPKYRLARVARRDVRAAIKLLGSH
jgi:tetratricopeptide (TPR) repeat protein